MVAALLASSSNDDSYARTMPLAHALVGAAESLSDWGLDHPEEVPNTLATRLMDFVWTGTKCDHFP